MSDMQVIGGLSLPTFYRDARICELKSVREDGTSHESKRICIRVRHKKGVVELYAMKDRYFVYEKFVITLPTMGLSLAQNVSATIRFTAKLSLALDHAMEALNEKRGHLQAVGSPHGWRLSDEEMNDSMD